MRYTKRLLFVFQHMHSHTAVSHADRESWGGSLFRTLGEICRWFQTQGGLPLSPLRVYHLPTLRQNSFAIQLFSLN